MWMWIPLSRSTPNIIGMCSWLRTVLSKNFKEIQSVAFIFFLFTIQTTNQTSNQPANQPTKGENMTPWWMWLRGRASALLSEAPCFHSPGLHVEVSLGKILNPKLLLMRWLPWNYIKSNERWLTTILGLCETFILEAKHVFTVVHASCLVFRGLNNSSVLW